MRSSSSTGNRGLSPLGITMGCPAGVGPEIIVKALSGGRYGFWPPGVVVVGDMDILARAARITGSDMRIREWKPGEPLSRGSMDVLPVTNLDVKEVPFGEPSRITGEASFSYLERGIALALEGTISGIVTAPLSKSGFRLAGVPYPGHTEVLAERTCARRFAMMLAGSALKVVLVTIHRPLREVPYLISTETILDVISLTHQALLRDFGLGEARIAVAGLNPHAGESGMFGGEEEIIIAPAVSAARAKGMDASGPYPPDTVFFRAAKGEFDAVVCQYHDQGLIPFKLLHFRDGVNVTLGLPIVRTSVDHGTAYDIAGKNMADTGSLSAALALARIMAENRSRAG